MDQKEYLESFQGCQHLEILKGLKNLSLCSKRLKKSIESDLKRVT